MSVCGRSSTCPKRRGATGTTAPGAVSQSQSVNADAPRRWFPPSRSRCVAALPSESDEKYIVLIFENGLAMKEQMILEDILGEIGRNNNLSNFPAKLSFEEANIRLVNYNKASKQKEEKVGALACRAGPTRPPLCASG